MAVVTASNIDWDPYNVSCNADPYAVFRLMRDEAPLYRNEEHGFYALSRWDDVEWALKERDTFLSCRGNVLEMIKAGVEQPPGTLIFEDPPVHTIHRSLLSRAFTPKRMAALEPEIRAFTAECLDPLVGAGGFDFVADLGALVPMQVIGMLLGIPESDQRTIRDEVNASLRTEPGKPLRFSKGSAFRIGSRLSEIFGAYIDWRMEHPSDDVITVLLTAEFEDEHGVRRCLTRDEALLYVNVVAGAGNETTNRLIGWAGKVLGEHPEQRRELAADPALVPNAMEELLRYEDPGPIIGRYVARDVEVHGQVVPAGSVILLLAHAANRDDRRIPDPDRFDIHRPASQHLTFGHGVHFCLGAALARAEGRIAVEEVLKRFPDWEVDMANARMASSSTIRGWDALPVVTT